MRLTRMTRSNSLSGAGPSRPTMRFAGPMPAQLTRIRAGPWTLAADLSVAVTSSDEETSQGATSPPIALATFRAACSFTSSTATLAPAAARARAVAAPNPEAVDIGQLKAHKVKHRADRRHWTDAHDVGRDPNDATGEDTRQGGFLVAPRVVGRADQHGCGAIDDSGGIATGLHAAEGGLER